jgi:hypothetical protein
VFSGFHPSALFSVAGCAPLLASPTASASVAQLRPQEPCPRREPCRGKPACPLPTIDAIAAFQILPVVDPKREGPLHGARPEIAACAAAATADPARFFNLWFTGARCRWHRLTGYFEPSAGAQRRGF